MKEKDLGEQAESKTDRMKRYIKQLLGISAAAGIAYVGLRVVISSFL